MIRHAESEENRRLGSIRTAAQAVARFSWPKSNDVSAALEWIRVSQQIDSELSDFGKKQVKYMAEILQESSFVSNSRIQLVAHSPLVRAKETSLGMLGCMAPDVKVDAVETVYELDLLSEKTPAEWIPGNSASFYRRLAALEDWIAQRPETVMALVGHSQFFKALLSLNYKFGNCDVVQVQFQSDNNTSATQEKSSSWSKVQEVHTCRLQRNLETNTPDTRNNGESS